MPTEKQLANLRPPYTPSEAREFGSKGGKKRAENTPKRKALEQIKNEIIEKSFAKVLAVLDKEEITFNELKEIFAKAVDMSGFKQNKEQIEASGFSVVINNKAKDVKRD